MMTNIPHVVSVQPLDDYLLSVKYESGEHRIFDVKPYLRGSWFGKLRDPQNFQTVRPEGRTVAWADGQDIAPHELYELSTPA